MMMIVMTGLKRAAGKRWPRHQRQRSRSSRFL